MASTSWYLRAVPKEVMHGVSRMAKQGYLHSVTDITDRRRTDFALDAPLPFPTQRQSFQMRSGAHSQG